MRPASLKGCCDRRGCDGLRTRNLLCRRTRGWCVFADLQPTAHCLERREGAAGEQPRRGDGGCDQCRARRASRMSAIAEWRPMCVATNRSDAIAAICTAANDFAIRSPRRRGQATGRMVRPSALAVAGYDEVEFRGLLNWNVARLGTKFDQQRWQRADTVRRSWGHRHQATRRDVFSVVDCNCALVASV